MVTTQKTIEVGSVEGDLKSAFKLAVLDTVDLLFWAGIPAFGVTTVTNQFAEMIYADLAGIWEVLLKYGPIFSAGLNILFFLGKRTWKYYRGEREVRLD